MLTAHLQLSEGVGVVSQVEGVEGAAGVEGVQALNTGGLAGSAEGLSLAHERHLAGHDGEDGLCVDQAGVAQVVQATYVRSQQCTVRSCIPFCGMYGYQGNSTWLKLVNNSCGNSNIT